MPEYDHILKEKIVEEGALEMLATAPPNSRDSEYLYKEVARNGQDEAAAAVAMSVVCDASMAPHLQSDAVAFLRSARQTALLERLARDATVKPWLRVLAVRGLSEEHPQVLRRLARDQTVGLWPRLEAVDRMGRAGLDDDLWSDVAATALDQRVLRFAVWWAGRLDRDMRLASLVNTEYDASVAAAIEDARVMVGMRTSAS
jgi:hypothetical protein